MWVSTLFLFCLLATSVLEYICLVWEGEWGCLTHGSMLPLSQLFSDQLETWPTSAHEAVMLCLLMGPWYPKKDLESISCEDTFNTISSDRRTWLCVYSKNQIQDPLAELDEPNGWTGSVFFETWKSYYYLSQHCCGTNFQISRSIWWLYLVKRLTKASNCLWQKII